MKFTHKVLALCLLLPSIAFGQEQGDYEQLMNPKPVFIKNAGQWKDGSLFYFTTGEFQATFFKDHIRFAVVKIVDHKHPGDWTKVGEVHQQRLKEESRMQGQCWDVSYPQSGDFTYKPGGSQKAYIGYINQNTSSQILYPDLFESLKIENVYPGVDVEFVVDNGILKTNYILHKAADIEKIKLKVLGFENAGVNASGSLILDGKYNHIVDSIPKSYLTSGDSKIPVKASYYQIQKDVFGFALPAGTALDKSLVIDPFYLDYSTYFYGQGSNGANYIYDVEVDKNNYSYLVGYTNDKFAGTPGTFDTTLNNTDGFLAKMPITGGTPIYVIYVGGSQFEYTYSMAATEKGDVYLTGWTGSGDFPITSGVLEQSKPAGTWCSFVFAIKSDGSALNYSTYVRGYSWVIDVNELGQVYIAPYGDNPYTETKNINPPGQVGGLSDANIIRLNAAGSKILNCVTLMGSDNDYVYALQVDHRNQVYVAGITNSDNLPVTSGLKNFGGAFKGGFYDGFLFKVDSAFTKYLISKYIGTSGYDYLSAITVNDLEEIFVHGIAGAAELPVPTNSYPGSGSTTGFGGASFIMKIQKTGLYPVWSTYIVNNTYAWRQRISVNAKDECVFAGTTWATNLPTTSDAFQKNIKSAPDGYLGKLKQTGEVGYLSYFGGSNYEYLFAVQTKRIGCVTQLIMGGYSASKDWPLKNAWKTAPTGTSFWSGAVCKWRDTLRVDPIEFGPDATNCDFVYRLLDAQNKGASYKWTTGDTVRSIIVKKPGTYGVTVTYGCGSLSDTITMKTVPSAKMHLPSDSLVCDKYSIVLDAKNDTIKGVKYLWSTGDTTQKITVNQSGTYMIDIETPVCGLRSDTINVNKVYSPKTGITPNDTLVCMPFTLELKSGNDSAVSYYDWNTGDTTRNLTVNKAGIYKVKISNFCGSLEDSIILESDSIPTVSYTVDSLLCDLSSYTTNTQPGSKYTTLLWNDWFDSTNRTFTESGTYTVEIKNQCATRTDTLKLLFQTSPKPFNVPNITWCDKIFASYKVVDNLNTTIYWSNGDTGHVFNIKDSGTFIGIAKNQCGEMPDTFRVKMAFAPKLKLGNDTLICDDPSFTIAPVINENADNYLWSTGAKTSSINVGTAGVYTVTATSLCGEVTEDIDVQFLQKPTVITSADQSFCDEIPTGFTVNATVGGGNSTGSWTDGTTATDLAVNQAGTYKYTVNNLCGVAADSVIIQLFNSPLVDLGKDSAYCGIPDLTLDAGPGFVSYAWNNGSTGQMMKIPAYGIYSVSVVDQNGCKGSDQIEIGAHCDLIFYVPSSFTPNNDGVNDFFGPQSKDIDKLHFTVYNRWGQVVFETNDPTKMWNGEVNGAPALDGVYVWRAEFSSFLQRYQMKGVVTLLH